MIVAGVEYVTTGEAVERLAPDVTSAMIRDWARRGLVRPATAPDGTPVQLPSRSGPQNVWRWSDIVDAEYRTRTSGAGRRRSA